jgi:hypothetical protein
MPLVIILIVKEGRKERGMLMNIREIEMNSNYWDCECNTNYIHSKKKESYCSVCKVYEFDQPDSREEEVRRMQKKGDADEY